MTQEPNNSNQPQKTPCELARLLVACLSRRVSDFAEMRLPELIDYPPGAWHDVVVEALLRNVDPQAVPWVRIVPVLGSGAALTEYDIEALRRLLYEWKGLGSSEVFLTDLLRKLLFEKRIDAAQLLSWIEPNGGETVVCPIILAVIAVALQDLSDDFLSQLKKQPGIRIQKLGMCAQYFKSALESQRADLANAYILYKPLFKRSYRPLEYLDLANLSRWRGDRSLVRVVLENALQQRDLRDSEFLLPILHPLTSESDLYLMRQIAECDIPEVRRIATAILDDNASSGHEGVPKAQ